MEVDGLRAKALEVFTFYNGYRDMQGFDLKEAIRKLMEDPANFCAGLNSKSDEPGVITWQWPEDIRREVMLPPDQFLLIKAASAFRARIMDESRTITTEDSLRSVDGSYFALFSPLPTPKSRRSYALKISIYASENNRHAESRIMALPCGDHVKIKRVFGRRELLRNNLLFLSTNNRGGMLRAPVSWGNLPAVMMPCWLPI